MDGAYDRDVLFANVDSSLMKGKLVLERWYCIVRDGCRVLSAPHWARISMMSDDLGAMIFLYFCLS